MKPTVPGRWAPGVVAVDMYRELVRRGLTGRRGVVCWVTLRSAAVDEAALRSESSAGVVKAYMVAVFGGLVMLAAGMAYAGIDEEIWEGCNEACSSEFGKRKQIGVYDWRFRFSIFNTTQRYL